MSRVRPSFSKAFWVGLFGAAALALPGGVGAVLFGMGQFCPYFYSWHGFVRPSSTMTSTLSNAVTNTVTTSHTLSDFDFALPERLIAQHPAPTRSGSRLLDGTGAQA